MKIPFTKMHGIGNDYIYVNCFEGELQNPEQISIVMSPRHFSVGSDGLIMICKSDIADAKMRMFNADGSEGKMCGNAIRCIGKFLFDKKIVHKENISVETLSGIKYLKLNVANDKVKTVEVDMGISTLEPKAIPVLREKPMIAEQIEVVGKVWNMTAVSMGNPHAVIFTDIPVADLDLAKIGPTFENLSIYPDRVNTEFINVIDDHTLQMRVWERGSGETWACGTGACASAVAACVNGYTKFETPITLHLIGGDLSIVVDKDYRVHMTGPAAISYEGVYDYED